ncbi:MAG: glucosamine-6-phosphate deaminase [Herbinix sp.]|jgi:glucosamine-6-phosphate isomerase|nr:glucosamine-6-phosphate deaminase [Herbinix sp.]
MIKIFDTEDLLAQTLASEMYTEFKQTEHPVYCLASGSTPAKTYHKFIDNVMNEAELNKLTFVSLDEWVGVPPTVDGSCYQMLYKDLFQHLPLNQEQIVFFQADGSDLEMECKRMDAFIKQHPITFSLMGVGMNGHIGLNEPGEPIRNNSSIVHLSDTTKEVAKKYFAEDQILSDGITLGLQQIMNSKKVAVVITGANKKEIVRQIFEDKNAGLPVQELLGYDHIDFYLDKEAYSLVTKS